MLNEESGMGCGYSFTQGEDHVVFARRTLDGDVAITCSGGIWMVRVRGRIFGEVSVLVPFFGPAAEPPNDTPFDVVAGTRAA